MHIDKIKTLYFRLHVDVYTHLRKHLFISFVIFSIFRCLLLQLEFYKNIYYLQLQIQIRCNIYFQNKKIKSVLAPFGNSLLESFPKTLLYLL